MDFDKIPECSGIYFIYGKYQELLYVGKSTNLRRRVKEHFEGHSHLDKYKRYFHDVKFDLFNEQFLDTWEKEYIHTLKPYLNLILYSIENKTTPSGKRESIYFSDSEAGLLLYAKNQDISFSAYIKKLIRDDMKSGSLDARIEAVVKRLLKYHKPDPEEESVVKMLQEDIDTLTEFLNK